MLCDLCRKRITNMVAFNPVTGAKFCSTACAATHRDRAFANISRAARDGLAGGGWD